jgi:hypothetical protein
MNTAVRGLFRGWDSSSRVVYAAGAGKRRNGVCRCRCKLLSQQFAMILTHATLRFGLLHSIACFIPPGGSAEQALSNSDA